MRILRRIVSGVAIAIAVILALLFGSIAIDALVGANRLDPLTNTVIPGADGRAVRAYVARPATPGPHPTVIMIHEWWGLREEIVGKADALAAEGYLVVAPDVFRGSTTNWIPRAIFQVATTPAAQVDADLDTVYAWLADQPEVAIDRVAIMGFCFGGGTALRYSLHNPAMAATAVFYGSTIADVERLRMLNGPVLGIFGGADTMIPLTEVRQFEQALDQAGVAHQISVYEGQPHAFVTSIEAIRAGGAPQQAWDELRAFLRTNLTNQPAGARSRGIATADQPPLTALPARALHLFVCNLTTRPT